MTDGVQTSEDPFALPIVQIEGNGDLARVCDQIESLLRERAVPIYQRGGMLVRVINEGGEERKGISRDKLSPRIVPFDDLSLAELVTRHIEVQRRNRKTGEFARIDCPRAIAQTLLARKEWEFPHLEAVVEHPIMLTTGEVLWESQYHEDSGLLLSVPLFTFISPENDPGREAAMESLEGLRGLLDGFPFVDDTDLSVALAFILTAFVRPVLPTSPAFGVDAHAPGSGKSTLIRVASRIATGREPAFITFGEDPTELRKLLFAALLEGDQQIAIDNVDVPVSGSELAVILTSPMYRGRVLGQSTNASVPTKAVISFNGNNLTIVGDLTRRVLVCRLDPMCERPAEREFDFDPIEEIAQARSEFVLQALTIMQAYVLNGERVSIRPFGSFEEWSRLVREPLIWLGLPDPVDSIRVLEQFDPERTQLRSMIEAVKAAQGLKPFKASDLIAMATAKHQRQHQLMGEPAVEGEAQEMLKEALILVCERNGELNVKALGKWLLRMKGRIQSGFRFVQRQQSTVSIWCLDAAQ